MNYSQLSKEELQQIYDLQKAEYDALKRQGYKVDIARGKPCNEQYAYAYGGRYREYAQKLPQLRYA